MNRSTTNRVPVTKNKPHLVPYDIVLVLSIVIYTIAEFYNSMFPFRFSLALFLGALIVTAIGLLVQKRWVKVVMTLIVLAMAITLLYSQFSLNRIVAQRSKSTQVMSLVVREDSTLQTLEDASGAHFGKSPSISQEMMDDLVNQLENVSLSNISDKDDDISLAHALLNQEIDVMILNEATRGTINEVINGFDTQTRVLGEVSVEVEKVDTAKHVNTQTETFTILISGIDTEGPVTSVSRSDVNILMTINPVTHEILTVSIPRDSYIPISCFGGGYDKLTHSGIRGVDCTLTSLENYMGIDINYYARVNFTSVINILNVVGPIDVYSHYTFTTNNGAYTFYEGVNTMNADQALMFSRERYNVPGGDITRGVHQQEVIKATMNKILSSINLFTIEPLINQINQSVDTNFDSNALSGLVQKQIDSNPSWNFNTFAITGDVGSSTTYLYPYQNLSIMYPNQAQVEEAVSLIEAMK